MTVLFLIGITSPSYAAPGDTGNGKEPPGATTSAEAKAEQKPAPQKPAPEKSEGKGQPEGKGQSSKPVQDLTKPQPLSNADQNTGGANGQCGDDGSGPYCSTRDGSDSMNGNGDGEAVGKPCAGCVGKADNKNPKGQMPDGTDHNAGYECDRNRGIGRTNPAHTGCVSDEDTDNGGNGGPNPQGPPPEIPPVAPPVEPDEDVVGGVEQERPRPPVVVLTPPMTVTPPAGGPTEVAPTTAVLPSTGADGIAGILGLGGLAMLLAGLGTLVARRRLG